MNNDRVEPVGAIPRKLNDLVYQYHQSRRAPFRKVSQEELRKILKESGRSDAEIDDIIQIGELLDADSFYDPQVGINLHLKA